MIVPGKWYSCNMKNFIMVQDPTHIGTKLRNLLLKPSVLLPVGPSNILNTHLKYLITTVSKDVHHLTDCDIDPKDRQNFRFLQKSIKSEVLDALKKYVPDCDATILFLKICHHVTDSYMNPKLTALERIHSIWYGIFVLRSWRLWIYKNDKFTVKENFITQNAYTCIELNGPSLIIVLVKCRDDGVEHLFLPPLFGSQPCESTFRQIRSMSSTYSTKVNSSLLEFIQKLKRIHTQGEIVCSTNMKNVKFPRLENKLLNMLVSNDLPSNEDIIENIEKAKRNAIHDLKMFNLQLTEDELKLECKLELKNIEIHFEEVDEEEIESDENIENEIVDNDVFENEIIDLHDLSILTNVSDNIQLKSYEKENILAEDNPFTMVTSLSGKTKIVKKSSIVWLLSTSNTKMSSDRLLRVQQNEIWCSDSIQIGEWAIFKTNNNRLLVGLILGFRYVSGTTAHKRAYSRDFAPIKFEATSTSVEPRGITVMCSFYEPNEVGFLFPTTEFDLVKIEKYLATLSRPLYENGKLIMSDSQFIEFKNHNFGNYYKL